MLLFFVLGYVLSCIVLPAMYLTVFKAPGIVACEARFLSTCHRVSSCQMRCVGEAGAVQIMSELTQLHALIAFHARARTASCPRSTAALHLQLDVIYAQPTAGPVDPDFTKKLLGESSELAHHHHMVWYNFRYVMFHVRYTCAVCQQICLL